MTNYINFLLRDVMKDELELEQTMIELISEMNERMSEDTELEKDIGNSLSRINEARDEDKEMLKIVSYMTILGLGRNRTLKYNNITRRRWEDAKVDLELNKEKVRKDYVRLYTTYKYKDKEYVAIKNIRSDDNYSKLIDRYKSGEPYYELSLEYNLNSRLVGKALVIDEIYDYTRSTHVVNQKALSKIDLIPDEYFIELADEMYFKDRSQFLERVKEDYPWMTRRIFHEKLIELNIKKTPDEVNEIRSLKSKNEKNTAYMIKVNSIKAVDEVFGSVDKMTKEFMTGNLGSYTNVRNIIREKSSNNYPISKRQVERLISENEFYEPRQSQGQIQLGILLNELYPNDEVIEEWKIPGTMLRVDFVIPSLGVAIEFNGDYWHSEEVIRYQKQQSAYTYHEDRANLMKSHGYKLCYIWENDWEKQYDVIKETLRSKEFNSELLNKYETEVFDSKLTPEQIVVVKFGEIVSHLQANKVSHNVDRSNLSISIPEHKVIICMPSYEVLIDKSMLVGAQKEYESEGIELITILPWHDLKKIKSFLDYRLNVKLSKRVYARKTKVVTIPKINKTVRDFIANNHILGYFPFRNIVSSVCLYDEDNTLLQVAIFCSTKDKRQHELKRLVSLQGISVVGGASKLLKHHRRESDIDSIMTFSDCDLGFGSVYSTLGFELIERSGAQFNWYHPETTKKFSNISLVMVGADRLLSSHHGYTPVGQGKGLPNNQEIVESYGFLAIYDTGYKKWILNLQASDK